MYVQCACTYVFCICVCIRYDLSSLILCTMYKVEVSAYAIQFPTMAGNDNFFAACYDNGVLNVRMYVL